ncbi:MAG TPA: molybdenum cofactor guanylyltransferase [Blastocatellia bacterium]|nr:molybdenum cofactor guanylyltransferase [Blastocatellia bacterium]
MSMKEPGATVHSPSQAGASAHDVTAFIQAGGESRRLGLAKARLSLGSHLCIEYVVEAARRVTDQIIVIANDPENFEFLQLPILPDLQPRCGPLGGLATALTHCPTSWALNLACDLPFVTEDLLKLLLTRAWSGCEAVVPRDAVDQPQPLCALYSRTCLPVVSDLLRKGERSLRSLLLALTVSFIPFAEICSLPGASYFFLDIDTPDDYRRAQQVIALRAGPRSP